MYRKNSILTVHKSPKQKKSKVSQLMNDLLTEDVLNSQSKRSRSKSMHFKTNLSNQPKKTQSQAKLNSNRIFQLIVKMMEENFCLSEDDLFQKIFNTLDASNYSF